MLFTTALFRIDVQSLVHYKGNIHNPIQPLSGPFNKAVAAGGVDQGHAQGDAAVNPEEHLAWNHTVRHITAIQCHIAM